MEIINTNDYRGKEFLVVSGQYIFSEAYSHLKFGASSAAINVKGTAASDKLGPVDTTDQPHQSTQRRKNCNNGKEKGNKAKLYTFTKSL